MFWTHWAHKKSMIPQHALLRRSGSVTLLTRGNSRQRWGRKAGGTTVGHQWMTKAGLCGRVGKQSLWEFRPICKISWIMLPECTGMSAASCARCWQCLVCPVSFGAVDLWPCFEAGHQQVHSASAAWVWDPKCVCCGCQLTGGWCLQASWRK